MFDTGMLYHCKAASSAAHRVLRRTAMRLTENGCVRTVGWITSSAGLLAFTVFLILASVACDVERRKSDAELGLNPQQSAGRKIYDAECDRCHEPYSTRGKKGPGLKGVFQHKYLSLSGLPANDERVTDIIRLGRNEMPGYSQKLSTQDIQDLLAYLHTL